MLENHRPRATALRHALGVVASVLALVVGTGLLTAGPAAAHASLLATDPAAGAVLDAAPREVTLTFSEEVDPTLAAVTLTGPDGAQVPLDAPRVEGSALVQPVPATSGAQTLAYRVVSVDGHPVQGTLAFTVTPPAAPSTPTGPSPAPAAAPPATTSPGTAAPAPGTTEAATTPVSDATSSSGVPAWTYLLAGVLVVAAAGAVLVRRSTRG